jgi:hypothetical protein
MPNQQNLSTRIDHLDKLSRAELRVLWEREFSEKAPTTLGRDILALGIAYARQERRHGGLAKPVAKELDRLLARVLRYEEAGAPKPATTALDHVASSKILLIFQRVAPAIDRFHAAICRVSDAITVCAATNLNSAISRSGRFCTMANAAT